MTIFKLIDTLKNLALCLPNVRSASEGDIYRTLNNNPATKYDVVHIMQNTHQHLEYLDRYNLTIFFVSRLDDTLEDNRLQCQSVGKEVLKTLITDFCNMYELDFPTYTVQVFTEKFVDLCAGCFVNLTFEIPADACADDFSEVISIYQSKTVDITENGEYFITPDSNYTALKDVTVNVDVRCSGGCSPEELEEMYESGYTDGYNEGLVDCGKDYDEGYKDGTNDQKAKLSAITITVNGDYNRNDGYSAITVNVPQTGYTQDDLNNYYNSGYTSGITYQKSLLSAITITENGNYNRENGYSAVTVNINTQAYFNSGFTSGTTYQKSLLASTAFTQNGTYTRQNGWSAVTVNIDTQAYYNSGYTSGYTDGYDSGYTDGVNKDVLIVYPSSFYASETGETRQIFVATNTDWKVTSKPNWVSFDKSSGSTTTVLNATITANTTGVNRTGAINYSTTNSASTASTTIIQNVNYTPKGDTTDYLTMTVLNSGVLRFISNNGYIKFFYYSINGEDWVRASSGTYPSPKVTLNAGDVVRLRGNVCENSDCTYGTDLNFAAQDGLKYNLDGNIMSMIQSSNFSGLTDLSSYTNVFMGMFWGVHNSSNCGLVDASGLLLPATTLGTGCYKDLFKTQRLLTKAPTLPASILVEDCYEEMFKDCSNLNKIKCLATNISATDCTTDWVKNVSSSGTFTKKTSMNNWTTGASGIPSNWTIQNAS